MQRILKEPSWASAWIDHCLSSGSLTGLKDVLFLEGMTYSHGLLPAASSYYLSIIGNYFLLGHHSTFSVPRIHSYYSIKTIPRDTLVSSRGLKQNMVKKKKKNR